MLIFLLDDQKVGSRVLLRSNDDFRIYLFPDSFIFPHSFHQSHMAERFAKIDPPGSRYVHNLFHFSYPFFTTFQLGAKLVFPACYRHARSFYYPAFSSQNCPRNIKLCPGVQIFLAKLFPYFFFCICYPVHNYPRYSHDHLYKKLRRWNTESIDVVNRSKSSGFFSALSAFACGKRAGHSRFYFLDKTNVYKQGSNLLIL